MWYLYLVSKFDNDLVNTNGEKKGHFSACYANNISSRECTAFKRIFGTKKQFVHPFKHLK